MKVINVILVSGGVDSVTLLHYAKRTRRGQDVLAFSFHYGQKHVKELECAAYHCEQLGVPHEIHDIKPLVESYWKTSSLVGPDEVPEGDQKQSTIVPFRNPTLILLAASWLWSRLGSRDLGVVWYAAHKGDATTYPDCTPEFVTAMNDLLLKASKPYKNIEVFAPFVHLTKAEVVRLGLLMEVDYAKTWTCYKGGERPCNVCGACVERAKAFKEAGVKDPLEGR